MLTIRLRVSGPKRGSSGDYRASIRTVEAGAALSGSILWRLVPPDAVGTPAGAGARAAKALLVWANSRDLDLTDPVDVVELSAGTGEYSRELCTTLLDAPSPVRFRVVVTDPDKRTAQLLARDSVLRPYIRKGLVDVACYDPALDPLVVTLTKGDSVFSGATNNPLVVCSHGDLGRRPADLIRFDMGNLREALVMLTGPTSIPDPPRPHHLHRLELEWRWRDTDTVYYQDDRVRASVEEIAEELDLGAVPIPVGAVHALDRLRGLANDRLLLIAEEGGSDDLHALLVSDTPSDGITLPTNLFVLADVARASGGSVAVQPTEEGSVFLCEFADPPVDVAPLVDLWRPVEEGMRDVAGLAGQLEANPDPFALLQLDLSQPLVGSADDVRRLKHAVEAVLDRLAALQQAKDLPSQVRSWMTQDEG